MTQLLIDPPDLTALAAAISVLAPILALSLASVFARRLVSDEPPDKLPEGFGI